MKTKTNTRHASMMTMLLWAALVPGTSVLAQSDPEVYSNEEVNGAYIRLYTMMNTIEEDVRYVAPSNDYDDIRSAWERLDMLANRTESEIKYKVPAVEVGLAYEPATNEDTRETGVNGLLSDNKKSSKVENDKRNGMVQ